MQRDASDTRVNPDLILKAIEKDGVADDTRTSRGHLKIFFGYAAGTGKTYAMLQAAHAAKRRGAGRRLIRSASSKYSCPQEM